MILKLKEAGEEATLDITSAEVVTGQYGQQVKFDANTGDCLYVPLSSVERQLDRCGVAEVSELSGKTIHFSRTASNKPGAAPYWDLSKATPADLTKKNGNGTTPPTKPAVKAAVPYSSPGRLPGENEDFDTIINRYGECLAAAQTEIAPVLRKADYQITAENVIAIAATLYIERNRRNV